MVKPSSPARAGGVAVAPLAQVHGHVAGEEEQIALAHALARYFVDGEALDDVRVAVDADAAEHVGHGGQPRTVDAQRRLAAPAVVRAAIEHAPPRRWRAADPASSSQQGAVIVRAEDGRLHKALAPVGQNHLLPAVFRLAANAQHRAARHALQNAAPAPWGWRARRSSSCCAPRAWEALPTPAPPRRRRSAALWARSPRSGSACAP